MTQMSWDGLLSTETTNDILREIASAHLGELSSSCYQDHAVLVAAISSGDYRSVCGFQLDYTRAWSPNDLYHVGQVLAFFKKRVDLDLGIDRRDIAKRKFVEAEGECLKTNNMFKAWQAGRFMFDRRVEAVLFTAQRKISAVLGPCPSLEELHPHFGPGATTQVGKRSACAKVKLSQKACCSEDLISRLEEVLAEIPAYTFLDQEDSADSALVDCEIHPGRVSFVPKSAKEDRAVVVEPWLNTMFQLGIGQYIARRLRKQAGIDLTNQTRNRNLARVGSLTGALATLDLSSASDCISTKLVEHLLPPEWFDLLLSFRTGIVELDGVRMRLEKISSMGNGYTFPLESLIFWALTSSVCGDGETVSVFGDDIICPTLYAGEVMRVLNCVGFTVNQEKSFWTGRFRESCGGDYWMGIDVRPCYIKGPLRGQDLFRLHNYYVRALETDLATLVRKHIPDNIVLHGPDGYGDGHLIGSWSSHLPEQLAKRGYGGAVFETWCYSKREFNKRSPGDRILPVYSIYTRERAMTIWEECQRLDREMKKWLINQDFHAPSLYEGNAYRFTRSGVPVDNLPGTKGCKRIAIYTLQLS